MFSFRRNALATNHQWSEFANHAAPLFSAVPRWQPTDTDGSHPRCPIPSGCQTAPMAASDDFGPSRRQPKDTFGSQRRFRARYAESQCAPMYEHRRGGVHQLPAADMIQSAASGAVVAPSRLLADLTVAARDTRSRALRPRAFYGAVRVRISR
jgi:hypothetical protein